MSMGLQKLILPKVIIAQTIKINTARLVFRSEFHWEEVNNLFKAEYNSKAACKLTCSFFNA